MPESDAPAPRPWCPDGPQAEVVALGDRIAELSARIQAATWELLSLIRQFDERNGWAGCMSCAEWLGWRTGLAPGAAREHVRVARALADLPKLSDAMRRGKVSYSKMRAVTRVATPETEDDLLNVALSGTAAHVEKIVRAWRRVDRLAEQGEDRRRHETRSLRTWVDENGMVVVRGRLSPEVGAVLRRSQAPCPGPRPAANTPAGRCQTVLEEAGGIHISAETARRLACDASTVGMRHGSGGEILAVGRRTRTISPALRRALNARDRQCRFPGCRNVRVDVHHVRHWADGGATTLDNLVLLCRRHHRAVHEEGFRVTLDAAGHVELVRPDGRRLPEAPAPPDWTGRPLAPVRSRLERDGISIDPDTLTPDWRGERLDLDWVIHQLWRPRPQPEASREQQAADPS